MRTKKEKSPVKLAHAFGMVRSPLGYIKKEELVFTLTDDSRKTKKLIDDFAKKNNLTLVEVWYRITDEWGKVIPYKVYSYNPIITGEILDEMRR